MGRHGGAPYPLPGDAAAGGGEVAGGGQAPTDTEMGPARAGAWRRWLWARGCVWHAPTHVLYMGTRGRRCRRSLILPLLSLPPSWTFCSCADCLFIMEAQVSQFPSLSSSYLSENRKNTWAFAGSYVMIKPILLVAPTHPTRVSSCPPLGSGDSLPVSGFGPLRLEFKSGPFQLPAVCTMFSKLLNIFSKMEY